MTAPYDSLSAQNTPRTRYLPSSGVISSCSIRQIRFRSFPRERPSPPGKPPPRLPATRPRPAPTAPRVLCLLLASSAPFGYIVCFLKLGKLLPQLVEGYELFR